MWSNFKDYVYKKIIEPVVSRKRRIEESNESPPNKHIKLDYTNSVNRGEPVPFFKTAMASKESLNCDEDDECAVVHSPKKNWEPSPMMGRRSIRTLCVEPQLEHPKDMTPMLFGSHNHKDRSSAIRTNENKDIETNRFVKNDTSRSKSTEVTKKNIADRIFQLPSNNNQNGADRPRRLLPDFRKKLNVLQESHHYRDKYNYMKLLQMHTIQSIFTIQKPGINSKPVKPSVPVVDLTKERSVVIVDKSHESVPQRSSTHYIDLSSDDSFTSEKQKSVQRVNSFEKILKSHPVLADDYVSKILASHAKETEEKRRQAARESRKLEVLSESNRIVYSQALEERLQHYMQITSPAIDEVQAEEEKYVLPELTDEQEIRVNKALASAPAGQILVENFGLQIKRRDIQTLKGLNWLNDEVINFYMNLIMERGKIENMPKVYAFNTFFYPKLLSSGHSSLKRWTKKVDIFSHDMVLVPVHLGMHWCMSVMDFRNKQVRYYDSMGSPNDRCLQALLSYLEAESLDKKKKSYDTSDWEQVNVDDIPQQMNGSDCGVFSCMFAEHLARDCPILFTQDHMPYFRRKMILEILETKLLT